MSFPGGRIVTSKFSPPDPRLAPSAEASLRRLFVLSCGPSEWSNGHSSVNSFAIAIAIGSPMSMPLRVLPPRRRLLDHGRVPEREPRTQHAAPPRSVDRDRSALDAVHARRVGHDILPLDQDLAIVAQSHRAVGALQRETLLRYDDDLIRRLLTLLFGCQGQPDAAQHHAGLGLVPGVPDEHGIATLEPRERLLRRDQDLARQAAALRPPDVDQARFVHVAHDRPNPPFAG